MDHTNSTRPDGPNLQISPLTLDGKQLIILICALEDVGEELHGSLHTATEAALELLVHLRVPGRVKVAAGNYQSASATPTTPLMTDTHTPLLHYFLNFRFGCL